MSIRDNRSLLNNVLNTKLANYLQPKQNRGLLDFVKSPYGRDIASGLLAQSGYSTMPTTLGQSLGVAMNQANQLRDQRNANQLAELATLTNLKSSFAEPDRQIVTGADGYQYYLDGTRVLPDVKAPAPKIEAPRTQVVDGVLYSESQFGLGDFTPITEKEKQFQAPRSQIIGGDLYTETEYGKGDYTLNIEAKDNPNYSQAVDTAKALGSDYYNEDTQQFTPAGIEYIKNATISKGTNVTTNVSANREFEDKYDQTRGENTAEFVNTVIEEGETAQDNLFNYDAINSLLTQFDTGIGSNFAITVNNLASRFGLDLNLSGDTASGEALLSFTGDLTMNTLQKFSGAISDGERAFATKINPNLSMSKEGIQLIMEINRKVFENQIIKSDQIQDWEAKYGNPNNKNEQEQTFNQYWRKYLKDNPIFDDDLKARIEKAEGKIDQDFADQIIENNGKSYIEINNTFYEVKN